MTVVESLDHNPQAVTLEVLPDGGARLLLHKDVKEVQNPAPDGSGTCAASYECTTAICKLDAERADETVESIAANFAEWWEYAAAWNGDKSSPTVEERLAAVEDMLIALTEV